VIKLALPTGDLREPSARLLEQAGIANADYAAGSRLLRLPLGSDGHDAAIRVFRERDIPIQVALGNYDLGICGLAWIEEPLGAWDPEGYANLRAKTTTLIAYGEKEWTLEGFERVLATGTVDVVGVDPGRAEGITGFKKVTDRVEAYRRQANAHAWSSAIVTAASLAISFSSPACKLFEFKPLRNPMQHDLVTKPFEHVNGWVYPPAGPGLGIEVIEEVVEGYRSEKVLERAK